MQICVIGSGSMGSLFAARLALSGQDVCVLGAWQEQLTALRAGLELQGTDGSLKTVAIAAYDDPADCPPADLALVLVKSYQTERAASHAAKLLKPDGLALSLQNGVGNYELLVAALGEGRVLGGVTTQAAMLDTPGKVRDTGRGPVHMGARPGAEPVAACLRQAGFEVRIAPDIRGLTWSKLVINAGINAPAALLGVPNGYLLQDAEWGRVMAALGEEAAAVAAAEGVALTYDDPEAALRAVCAASAGNDCSMLRDVKRGARTEVEAINGYVVARGEAHGMDLPLNREALRLVQALEAGQRRSGDRDGLESLLGMGKL